MGRPTCGCVCDWVSVFVLGVPVCLSVPLCGLVSVLVCLWSGQSFSEIMASAVLVSGVSKALLVH